jgi:hypothetical protein
VAGRGGELSVAGHERRVERFGEGDVGGVVAVRLARSAALKMDS